MMMVIQAVAAAARLAIFLMGFADDMASWVRDKR
jgi:hypothetical protein